MRKLRDILGQIQVITYRASGEPVERTVAESLARELVPGARVVATARDTLAPVRSTFRISLWGNGPASPQLESRITFQIGSEGAGHLTASHPHWLYAAFCLVRDEWLDRDGREFEQGKSVAPTFAWLRNLSDFFVGSLRHCRHFDGEDYLRQLARLGFSHVSINGLGVTRPFESAPPGDVYSWFYDYSPDLDQFVESRLLNGYYPPDYLQANLNFLKHNAVLAHRYGLTPGLHINSPRSMPEEFWHRYGFLRGARVDHPRESVRPRYTLAMAHPVVQQHYRDLIRNIMEEIPSIGFIHLWTNDSGAGFEFVTSLYAGRNGGPYLIREWKSDEEISRKAALNVLTYFRILRDEGKKANRDFRLICDLAPFFVERKHIIPELGNGIDAGEFASFESPEYGAEQAELSRVGAHRHMKLDVSDNNVIGVPYPKLVYDRLTGVHARGTRMVLASANPASLAPYDINCEVIRSIQLTPGKPLQAVLEDASRRWVGEEYAGALVAVWETCDAAVTAYPAGIPYSTFAFPWFRLWVRPFVPNIDAVPESERSYYEKFLLATFNNPARVDLNNDMMWNFLSVEEAAEKKSVIDTKVLPSLAKAIDSCTSTIGSLLPSTHVRHVFRDVHDRIVALRCFYATMRNTMAWTEAVHGYLETADEGERVEFRSRCRAMVANELENAKALLQLWETSDVDFMPVSRAGETLHIYGENFGDLLNRKIRLMGNHIDDEPSIDPNYMWRMPNR